MNRIRIPMVASLICSNQTPIIGDAIIKYRTMNVPYEEKQRLAHDYITEQFDRLSEFIEFVYRRAYGQNTFDSNRDTILAESIHTIVAIHHLMVLEILEDRQVWKLENSRENIQGFCNQHIGTVVHDWCSSKGVEISEYSAGLGSFASQLLPSPALPENC